jgi:hypothetical protein
MRYLWLATLLALVAPSIAAAEDEADPRAIMREAAVEQADTVPPANGPATEASATAKSRADGQQGRLERNLRAGSADAHRAAVSAARAAAAAANAAAAAVPGGVSPAGTATTRSGTVDAAHRGAAGVAQERSVRGGSHGGPPFANPGGRP